MAPADGGFIVDKANALDEEAELVLNIKLNEPLGIHEYEK